MGGDAESDRLQVGAGQDVFVFKPKGGVDTVVDFRHGSDLLDVSALGLSWGDIDTLRQGRDLQVELGGGAEIVLLGLGSQGLERSDVVL